MFTRIRDNVLKMVARGERGVPGTPGDYDYETAAAAFEQNIPVIRKTFRAGGRFNLLDKGNATWARVASEPALPASAKGQSLDGGWWELSETRPDLRMFGARGDGAIDDTTAIQDAWDYGVAKSCMVQVSKGRYLTRPTYMNGRAWVTAGKPQAGAQPSCRGIIGEGMILFGATFVAMPGGYASGEAVITGRNLTYKSIIGIHVDCASVADVGLDLEWRGTASGAGGAAPACANVLRDVVVENALEMGINIDQFVADSNVMSVAYRGGTPPVGISCKLPGGAFALTDVKCYRGVVEFCAQNATFTGCLFAGGARLTDAAIDLIVLNGSQLYCNPDTGYSFESLTLPGSSGPNGILFIGCDWVGGSAHTFYFGGRYRGGLKFIANTFEKPTTTFWDPANFTAIAGNAPPMADFEVCQFLGGGAAFPPSLPGQILVGHNSCVRPDNTQQNVRVFGFDISVGETGRIAADKFQALASGFYGRGQGTAVVPTDAYFGQGYNRSGSLGEVEQIMRGDVFRLTKYDGSIFTTVLTYNIGAANGLYPGNDNVRNLGIASNRWAAVYAGSGSINTSDERMKRDFRPFTEKELAAAKALAGEIIMFRFRAAVDEKGDRARTHCGMTVQRAMEIMDESGLDPFDYAFICYDRWDKAVVHFDAVYTEAEDEEGNKIQGELIRDAYDETTPAGDLYSFRPDQLAFFIMRGQAEIQTQQDRRLVALEAALPAGNA